MLLYTVDYFLKNKTYRDGDKPHRTTIVHYGTATSQLKEDIAAEAPYVIIHDIPAIKSIPRNEIPLQRAQIDDQKDLQDYFNRKAR